VRQQRRALVGGGVVVAVVGQRRVVERVDLVGPAIQGLEVDVDQQRRACRVGGVGLDDPVPARLGGVDLLVAETAPVGQPGPVVGGVALEVGEGGAVADDQLEVAHARVSSLGKYTSVSAPPLSVYQTLLASDRAVPKPSLSAASRWRGRRGHRGRRRRTAARRPAFR
jgi:hypothetical protein